MTLQLEAQATFSPIPETANQRAIIVAAVKDEYGKEVTGLTKDSFALWTHPSLPEQAQFDRFTTSDIQDFVPDPATTTPYSVGGSLPGIYVMTPAWGAPLGSGTFIFIVQVRRTYGGWFRLRAPETARTLVKITL